MAVIFDIQRFSLFDGPGIRTAVFFKGCPLDCLWCHNPESKNSYPQLLYYHDKCIGCGECVSACSNGAHMVTDGLHRLDRTRCSACGACTTVCPSGALLLAGRNMNTEQIMQVVRSDLPFYAFDGGLTLTGGEPLVQPEAVMELLRTCSAEGIHTAVETCGHVPSDAMRAAAANADLLLFDLKHPDNVVHEALTGRGNSLILNNLQEASCGRATLWIRIPFIPGKNSSDEDALRFARLIQSVPGAERVEVLPFHTMGAAKCTALGILWKADGIPNPDLSALARFASVLSECGIPVKVL